MQDRGLNPSFSQVIEAVDKTAERRGDGFDRSGPADPFEYFIEKLEDGWRLRAEADARMRRIRAEVGRQSPNS